MCNTIKKRDKTIHQLFEKIQPLHYATQNKKLSEKVINISIKTNDLVCSYLIWKSVQQYTNFYWKNIKSKKIEQEYWKCKRRDRSNVIFTDEPSYCSLNAPGGRTRKRKNKNQFLEPWNNLATSMFTDASPLKDLSALLFLPVYWVPR